MIFVACVLSILALPYGMLSLARSMHYAVIHAEWDEERKERREERRQRDVERVARTVEQMDEARERRRESHEP